MVVVVGFRDGVEWSDVVLWDGEGDLRIECTAAGGSLERDREKEEKRGARQGRLVSDHEESPACSKISREQTGNRAELWCRKVRCSASLLAFVLLQTEKEIFQQTQ